MKGKEERHARDECAHAKEYFAKVGVAWVKITEGHWVVGDTIRMKSHAAELTQRVDSIQLEYQSLKWAEPGHMVGVRVHERIRPHDQVFKVAE